MYNNDITFLTGKNKINLTCMVRVHRDTYRQIFLSWDRHKISFPLLYSFFSPSLSIHNCQCHTQNCHTQNWKQNTLIIKKIIYIDVKILKHNFLYKILSKQNKLIQYFFFFFRIFFKFLRCNHVFDVFT